MRCPGSQHEMAVVLIASQHRANSMSPKNRGSTPIYEKRGSTPIYETAVRPRFLLPRFRKLRFDPGFCQHGANSMASQKPRFDPDFMAALSALWISEVSIDRRRVRGIGSSLTSS